MKEKQGNLKINKKDGIVYLSSVEVEGEQVEIYMIKAGNKITGGRDFGNVVERAKEEDKNN